MFIKVYNVTNSISNYNTTTNRNNNIQKPNSQQNFTGLFSCFKSSKEPIFLNTDMSILSPKQVKKATEYVIQEVGSLVKRDFTPGASKRLENLLNSPYIDYSLPKLKNGLALIDLVDVRYMPTKENKLRSQFIRTSLAKTMPMELLDKEAKKLMYGRNHGIFHIFQSYSKMDEASKEAGEVRDMILRMKEYGIKVDNYPEFFAECIFNNKPQMCNLLKSEFNITPETEVNILRGNQNKINQYSNEFGSSSIIIEDPYYNDLYDRTNKLLMIVNPEKIENRDFFYTVECSNDKINMLDLMSLMPDTAFKDVFDVPKYIAENIAGRTRQVYRRRLAPETIDEASEFFMKSQYRHPEFKTIEFMEKYISNLLQTKKANNLKYHLSSIPYSLETSQNKIKLIELIEQIKKDKPQDMYERLNSLEILYKYLYNN